MSVEDRISPSVYNADFLANTPIDDGIELPTPDRSELKQAFAQGLSRWGVLAPIMTVDRRGEFSIILMQHHGSEKVQTGEWSVMGETSQLAEVESGIVVEPTNSTIIRAIHEEIGMTIPREQVRVPTRKSFFRTTWPVGRQFPGKVGVAVSPVLIVDKDVAHAITEQPSTTEILRSELLPINHALELANSSADMPGRTRYGFQRWMHELMVHLVHVDPEDTRPLAQTVWMPPARPVDAILSNIQNL